MLLAFALGLGMVGEPRLFTVPFLVVFLGFGIGTMLLKCPRCKYPLFKAKLGGRASVWLPVPPRECSQCALSFVAEETRDEGANQGQLDAPEEVRSEEEFVLGDKPEYPIRVDFYRDGELLERDVYDAEWKMLMDLERFDGEGHELLEEARVFDRHGRPVVLKIEAARLLTFELVRSAPAGLGLEGASPE